MNPARITNENRKKLHLPEREVPQETFASTLEPHYHVWAESGWDGIASPAVGSIDEANRVARELHEDVGGTVKGSASFPLTQAFIVELTDARPSFHAKGLNVTLRSCRPQACLNRTGAWR